MDTSSDSTKRPRSEEQESNISQKRSKVSGDSIMLKQLIPSLISGLIIGKGGEAITKLQAETNTVIKMSKNGDFFPGTTDRVCVIVGTESDVREAHTIIWDRINKRHELSPEESKIRLVVPNVTVGMIIGKGGCYVKQIKDETGTNVQITQKSANGVLTERVVTISGMSMDHVMKGFDMVFEKIAQDPQSSSCPNLSYSDFNMPGSANTLVAAVIQSSQFSGLGSFDKNLNPIQIEALKSTLRNNGCTLQVADEITSALIILFKYGLLGHSHNSPNTMTLDYLSTILNGGHGQGMYGRNNFLNGNSQGDNMVNYYNNQPFSMPLMSPPMDIPNDNNGECTKEMQVIESLVGAILGPGGRNLVDIQRYTSTNIQISKKGIFAPGTKNRVVSISGTSQSIERAMGMIQQCIQQEESKRSRQESR